MRRLSIALISAVSVIALTQMASAAPPPPAPLYNWTGFYVGMNFGVGWGTSNNATTTSTTLADNLAQFFPQSSPSGSTALSGIAGVNQRGPIGGAQFGYNWQFDPRIIFGFEADIQGAAISGKGTNFGTATESFAGTSGLSQAVLTANSVEGLAATFTNAAVSASGLDVTADVRWLGTVRGRLGYLVTPNFLLYVTGGLAYGGVSASETSPAFNLSADSFALAYAQASGPGAAFALAVGAGANPTASSNVNTNNTLVNIAVTPSSLNATISGTTASGTGFAGPPTSAFVATASAPGESSTGFAQASKPLSAAITTTSQKFGVSETRVGGTFGGGFEWMMAPNWSFKTEAIYYNLGSVTVTRTFTTSINPLTAGISSTTSSATGAINNFVGPATVSNTVATRVKFDGIILRVGLNYHFNGG
jgi:opacity protein-like surface antigen